MKDKTAINKNDVISYFDKCAENWDRDMIRSDEIISAILDNAHVSENMTILDVACGTGVLFNDYLKRRVSYITGIDISPEMVKRAIANYKDPRISVVCGDIYDMTLEDLNTSDQHIADGYDVAMVYNAFPHFSDHEGLIRQLAGLIKPGGRVSIAHGMSREKINAHHSGSAGHVSCELITAKELQQLMSQFLTVDTIISNSDYYQVCGTLTR